MFPERKTGYKKIGIMNKHNPDHLISLFSKHHIFRTSPDGSA
jgi:hypothetical protein